MCEEHRVGGSAVPLVLRARLRRRWAATAAVALLVGVSGGVVLAALSGARHVETAYDRLIQAVDSPDVIVGACDSAGCDATGVAGRLLRSRVAESAAITTTYSLPALTTDEGRFLAVDEDFPCSTGDHEVGILSASHWGPARRPPVRITEGRPPRTDALE